jgi:hypothetical protein
MSTSDSPPTQSWRTDVAMFDWETCRCDGIFKQVHDAHGGNRGHERRAGDPGHRRLEDQVARARVPGDTGVFEHLSLALL